MTPLNPNGPTPTETEITQWLRTRRNVLPPSVNQALINPMQRQIVLDLVQALSNPLNQSFFQQFVSFLRMQQTEQQEMPVASNKTASMNTITTAQFNELKDLESVLDSAQEPALTPEHPSCCCNDQNPVSSPEMAVLDFGMGDDAQDALAPTPDNPELDHAVTVSEKAGFNGDSVLPSAEGFLRSQPAIDHSVPGTQEVTIRIVIDTPGYKAAQAVPQYQGGLYRPEPAKPDKTPQPKGGVCSHCKKNPVWDMGLCVRCLNGKVMAG